jgi:hypothetical protein
MLPAMATVGQTLRHETIEAGRALDAEQRILLAWSLGDSDLELAVAANAGTPAEVRARLVRQRQAGRRPSRCAAVR